MESQPEDTEMFEAQLFRARGGDAEALRWVLSVEADWLFGRCKGMLAGGVGARASVEDLLQETVTRILASKTPLRCRSRFQFRALLGKVAKHLIRDYLKRFRCENLEAEELVVDSASLTSAIGIRAYSNQVIRAREALSHKEEASLVLRSHCGLDMDVVAFVLNCPSVPAATRLHSRAMNKLRTAVAMP